MNHAELREALPAYALGSLETDAAETVRGHLEAGCPGCADLLRDLEAAAAALGSSVTPVAPPAHVRQAILRAAAATRTGAPAPDDVRQVWKAWEGEVAPDPLSLVRAEEGVWQEAMAGVLVKRLSLDPENRMTTMLIRMRAGTCYPRHRHGGAEECYVLEGDLHVGDLVMRSGDFQRAEADSVHVPQFTESGCLLLVTSSLDDELA